MGASRFLEALEGTTITPKKRLKNMCVEKQKVYKYYFPSSITQGIIISSNEIPPC
jgi:hypothetical protein